MMRAHVDNASLVLIQFVTLLVVPHLNEIRYIFVMTIKLIENFSYGTPQCQDRKRVHLRSNLAE